MSLGVFFSNCFSLDFARNELFLDCNLRVPDGPNAGNIKHFNDNATVGPFLRAFGTKGKYGLKATLEQVMWGLYDYFAANDVSDKSLPLLTARVGYRTKLMTEIEALKKIKAGTTFERAVTMLDAHEQATSSPLYNVVSSMSSSRRLKRRKRFKNSVIRTSSDWSQIWRNVCKAEAVVELGEGGHD